MSAKEQKRQKKLAKKRSKQIAARKEQARQKNLLNSFAGRMQLACKGDVHQCFLSSELLESEGRIGTAMIVRKMPNGRLACVRFLVDCLCLGVKSVQSHFFFPSELADLLDHLEQYETLQPVSAAATRKYVESAIQYAAKYGFDPGKTYQKHAEIWEGVDPADCKTEFHFGDENGNPCFIAGPNDTPQDVTNILSTLDRTAGEGNYQYDADALFGLENLLMGGGWDEDPELDVDIDEDVDENYVRSLLESELNE